MRPGPGGAPGETALNHRGKRGKNATPGTPSQLPIVGPKALRIPGKRNEKPCDDSSRFALRLGRYSGEEAEAVELIVKEKR